MKSNQNLTTTWTKGKNKIRALRKSLRNLRKELALVRSSETLALLTIRRLTAERSRGEAFQAEILEKIGEARSKALGANIAAADALFTLADLHSKLYQQSRNDEAADVRPETKAVSQ